LSALGRAFFHVVHIDAISSPSLRGFSDCMHLQSS
jgi:hypothetical protein